MLVSTPLLLDCNIRTSVCTPAKLPCRRVAERDRIIKYNIYLQGDSEISLGEKCGGEIKRMEIYISLYFQRL
jgi:hypothetical protein